MKKTLKILIRLFLLAILLIAIYIVSAYYTLYPKPYLNYDWDKADFSEQISEQLLDKSDFSILIFNAGLLDLRIHGETKVIPTEYIEERFAAIPSALLNTDADLIALQEVYEKEHIDQLIEKLKVSYPHYYFKHNSRWKLNNGLMLFSKYPLNDTKGMSQDEKGPIDEALLADRSLLSAVIEVQGKRISIVNLHATSGGTLHNQDDEVINVAREKQFQKAIDVAESNNTEYQIILGDMNAGPSIAQANHRYVLNKGFIDAHGEFINNAETDMTNSTWSGGNPLNAMRGYAASIQQRIDLVYLSNELSEVTTIESADKLYAEAVVKVNDGEYVPLSDHYGVYLALSIN